MLVPVLLFIVGLLFLIKGGDWFVDGASALARRFHLPELLIGATVVSIGTTLPEVMVSTMSAVSGHGEIAYGNAIGSVICNSALIAAITIAVRPGKVDPKTLKTPVIFFFIAAAIYCVAAYGFGEFTRPMGFIMLAMFVAYMVANVRQMKNAPTEEHAEEEELIPLSKTLILLVAGAALIAVGANLLVDNGTLIAQALGVPESVIALTFVALGTSLPELVTAITSLIKGHSDLSVGNVVGANVFNLVLVSGVSVTLAPFTIPQSSTLFGVNSSLVLDLPVMLAVMLIMTVPALVKGKMNRAQGIIFAGHLRSFLCNPVYDVNANYNNHWGAAGKRQCLFLWGEPSCAVLPGSFPGTLLGKVLPKTQKEQLPTMFGLCSIGVNSVIKASGMTAVVLALLVGLHFLISGLQHKSATIHCQKIAQAPPPKQDFVGRGRLFYSFIYGNTA